MLQKIGIREFRNNLAKYLNGTSPIAVMRHDQTVGYFLPSRPESSKTEIDSLKRAAAKLDLLLQENAINEDELVQEFRQLRAEEQPFF